MFLRVFLDVVLRVFLDVVLTALVEEREKEKKDAKRRRELLYAHGHAQMTGWLMFTLGKIT